MGYLGQLMRLLLVEDHEDTSAVMARLLKAAGYSVHVADCVNSALQVAERERFDVVVSDLGLPDGSGLELMRKLLEKQSIGGGCRNVRRVPTAFSSAMPPVLTSLSSSR